MVTAGETCFEGSFSNKSDNIHQVQLLTVPVPCMCCSSLCPCVLASGPACTVHLGQSRWRWQPKPWQRKSMANPCNRYAAVARLGWARARRFNPDLVGPPWGWKGAQSCGRVLYYRIRIDLLRGQMGNPGFLLWSHSWNLNCNSSYKI